jgi:hypothetical protein
MTRLNHEGLQVRTDLLRGTINKQTNKLNAHRKQHNY